MQIYEWESEICLQTRTFGLATSKASGGRSFEFGSPLRIESSNFILRLREFRLRLGGILSCVGPGTSEELSTTFSGAPAHPIFNDRLTRKHCSSNHDYLP